MADMALKHFGLEPGRDVAVVPLRGNRVAALESGAVDAALLGVPENIIAVDKGYNELPLSGGHRQFSPERLRRVGEKDPGEPGGSLWNGAGDASRTHVQFRQPKSR
jgi:hypothetical protein